MCLPFHNLQQTEKPRVPRKKKKTEDTLHGSTVHKPPVYGSICMYLPVKFHEVSAFGRNKEF